MEDGRTTHLFTEDGALCGASASGWRSLVVAAVTCRTCLALVELEARERRAALRRAVVVIARVATA